MASKKGGRLDKSSLEKALEDAFQDQEPVSPRIAPDGAPMMIHGHETTSGVDPNLAAMLHDKLAQEAGTVQADDEPTGLKAPCTTKLLSAQELAALDDEDAENVPIDRSNHGVIDNIDAKLLTELNKKLCDEVTHTHHGQSDHLKEDLESALQRKLGAAQAGGAMGSNGVPAANTGGLDANLSAALEKKLAGAVDENGLQADLGARFAGDDGADYYEKEDPNHSGLRAPQCTVKLSAEALAGLDDEDEEEDLTGGARSGVVSKGVDTGLVSNLQKALEGGRLPDYHYDDGRKHCSGLAAPSTTQKLDLNQLAGLDDEDEDVPLVDNKVYGNIGNVDANFVASLQSKLEGEDLEPSEELAKIERGCRAPKPTLKLKEDVIAGISGDDEIAEAMEDPLRNQANVPAAAAAKLNKAVAGLENQEFAPELERTDAEEAEEKAGALRAPESTKLITSDMLVGLDDEDDLPTLPEYTGTSASAPKTSPKKKGGVGFSASNADDPFANALQKKLAGSSVDCEDFADGDEVETKYTSGLSAPATTQQLTTEMLANLDAEEDDVPQFAYGDPLHGLTEHGLAEDLEHLKFAAENDEPKSGMKAPATTEVIDPSMLANLDDEDEDPGLRTGLAFLKKQEDTKAEAAMPTNAPSADQLATLTAAARALDGVVPNVPQKPQDPRSPTSPQHGPLTMDSDSATKVVQTARGTGIEENTWGQSRAPTSSCKLRLAWLSKDEVRKENDKLRKEIASLRAEIAMHRKEASLAAKA